MTRAEAESLFIAEALPRVRALAIGFAHRSGLPLSDLVQVGAIAAWQYLPKYQPDRGFKVGTFIRDRVCYAFVDYARDELDPLGRRASYRVRIASKEARPTVMSIMGVDVRDRGHRSQFEEADAFEDLISGLTTQQKTVVRLRFHEGFSNRKVAQSMGVGEDRIKQIVVEALAWLRANRAELSQRRAAA